MALWVKKGSKECHSFDPSIDIFWLGYVVISKVVKHMESFIVSSGLEPYDNISQVGHWKTLMLRTGEKTGDMMAWITIAPEGTSFKVVRPLFTVSFWCI